MTSMSLLLVLVLAVIDGLLLWTLRAMSRHHTEGRNQS